MSTLIKTIKGRREIVENKKIKHETTELNVSISFGGIELGTMIQLSTNPPSDHVQLSKEQTKELIEALKYTT